MHKIVLKILCLTSTHKTIMLKSLGNRGRKDKINAIRYPGKRFPLLGFFLGMQLAKVKNPK